MAGAATCVMVESSRSITAAAITTPNASQRHRRPASAPAPAPAGWPTPAPARAGSPAPARTGWPAPARTGWPASAPPGARVAVISAVDDDIGSSRGLTEQNLLFQL